MNANTTTTTAVCTAVSGGRPRVRVNVGFAGVDVLARAQRRVLRHRHAQRWQPVEAELALGIAARSQCCPSKHPDGYREAVLRR